MDLETKPQDTGFEGSTYDSSLEVPDSVPAPVQQATISEPLPRRPGWLSFSRRKTLLLVNGGVLLLVAVVGAASFFLAGVGSKQPAPSSKPKASNYAVSSLPVNNVKGNEQLQLGQADHLTINGQVTVGNTLVLAPTGAPANPTAGQIYYDQTTNQPYYYNGSRFVSLVQAAVPSVPANIVNSIGGGTGVIGLGSGLKLAGGQLSLQLQAGNGIAVNGPTVSNTGVVTLAGGTSNIHISHDSSGNYTISDDTIGLITGTGTAGHIPYFTTGQSLGDSILSQSGSSISVAGSLVVQGAASAASLTATNAVTAGSLNVAGGNLTVDNSGNLATAGTLNVTGTTTLSGTVNLQGTTTVTGSNSFRVGTGATVLGGTLAVTGNSTLTGSLSVGGGITANTLQSTAGHQLDVSAGSGVLNLISGGINFILPTNGGPNQTICTTGISCASGGGQAVLLGPNNFQTDNNANSIWIYNNNGGNLLNLEGGAGSPSARFLVDNAGNVTAVGTINGGTLSATAVNGLNVSLGVISSPTITGIITGTSSPTITGFGTYNGQTISNTANFTGTVAIQGSGGLTLGGGATPGLLNLASGANSNLGTLQVASLAQGSTYTLPDPGQSTDTICLVHLANCAGGGGGVTTVGGTVNHLAKFTGGQTIADSSIFDNGTGVSIGGSSPAGLLNVGTSNQFQVSSGGAVTAVGLNSGAGLIQGSGGLGITGNSTIAGTLSSLTGLTSSGTITFSGLGAGVVHASSLGVLSSSAIVNGDLQVGAFSSITGVGALASGSIASGFGTISTANNITTTAALQGGSLSVASGAFSVNSSGAITAATGITSSGTITFSGLSTAGIVTNTAGGQLGTVATLGVANGGTGTNTLTLNGILFGNGTGAVQATSAAANSVLATNASNVPGLTQTLPTAVQGNITQTGALAGGTITSGFGTISTGNNIATTATLQGGVVNATGSLQLNGANINTAGTLTNVAYLNAASQTFTGALTIQGSNALTLGKASTATGTIVFQGSGGTNTLLLQGPATPNAGNFTLSIPAITGNDTICTNGVLCAAYAAVSGDVNYIQNGTSPQTANFNITGNGTIGGTLAVTGISTLTGAVAAQGGLTVGVNSGAQGILTYAGPLGHTISLAAPTTVDTSTGGTNLSSSNITLKLPSALPATGAVFCLKSDSTGQLSFQNCLGTSGGSTSLSAIANKDSGGVPSNAIQPSASFGVQSIDYTSGNILKEGGMPVSLTGTPVDLLQLQDNNGNVLSGFSATGAYLRLAGASTITYSTGTMSQDGTVITGYGTSFTSSFSNGTIVYNDNTSGFVSFDPVGSSNPGTATKLTSSVTKFTPVYNTGTISQATSSCTINGSGTTFTSAMTNDVIVYNDGTTAIVTFVNATQLTSSNCNKTIAAGSSYNLYPADFVYSTGTITQSGCTITGTGTNFTSAMTNDVIVYSDNTTATVTYVSATQLTSSNCSKTISSPATYYLYQPTTEFPQGALFTSGTITQNSGGGSSCTITGTGTNFTSALNGDVIVYGDGNNTNATVTYVSATQLTSSNCSESVTNASYTIGPVYTIFQSYPGALTIGNSNSKTSAGGINLGGDTELFRTGNGVLNLQSASNVDGSNAVQAVTLQAGQLQGGTTPLTGTDLHIAGGDGTGTSKGGDIVLQVYAPTSSPPNYAFAAPNNQVSGGLAADSSGNFVWISAGAAGTGNVERILQSSGQIQTTKEFGTGWKADGVTLTGVNSIADCNGFLYFANINKSQIGKGSFNTSTGVATSTITSSLVTSQDTGIKSLACEVISGTTYLFWADANDGFIGYVPVDSSGNAGTPVKNFIQASVNSPIDLAAIAINPNSGSYLYYAAGGTTKSIQRANVSCVPAPANCQQSGGHAIATTDATYKATVASTPSGLAVNDFSIYWTIQTSNSLCTAGQTGINNICNSVSTAGTLPSKFNPGNLYATDTFLYFGSFTSNFLAQVPIGGNSPNTTSNALTISGQNGSATFQNATDSSAGFQILESQTYRSGIPLLTANTLASTITAMGQLSVQGGISTSSLGSMASNPLTLSTTCGGGSCTKSYTYVVTAVNGAGGATLPTPPNTISSANLATAPVLIKWSGINGAAQYYIYRTASDGTATYPTGLIAKIPAQEILPAGQYQFSDTIDNTGIISTTAAPPTVDTSGQLLASGTALFQNTTDSTTSFQIQNASTDVTPVVLFDADTTNNRIGIGTAAPQASLDVRQITNGSDAFIVRRATDTSPTGNFLRLQNAAGNADLAAIDINGNLAVQSATISVNLTLNGHLIGGGSALTNSTLTVHANAGAGASCTIGSNSHDSFGTITITTGSSGWAAGEQCKLTFATAYGTAPHSIITPAVGTAGVYLREFYISSTTTTMSINFNVADTASHSYTFNYFNAQ